MLADRIEGKWIEAFCEIFASCGVKPGDTAAILSETQSRALNVELAELALLRLGARAFHIVVPTPPNRHPVPVPPLVPETDEERRRQAEARIRREQRLLRKEALRRARAGETAGS